jgi:hypothetical protein
VIVFEVRWPCRQWQERARPLVSQGAPFWLAAQACRPKFWQFFGRIGSVIFLERDAFWLHAVWHAIGSLAEALLCQKGAGV